MADKRNISMNHYNGDIVRKEWPIGMPVKFKPKGWCSGESLNGEIVGHLYVNLLIIKSGNTEWAVSTFRTEPKLTREELIELCELAVVHHTKWDDRDSYLAQKSIQSIYKGLTAELDFRIVTKEISPDYHSDDDTLIIEFPQPINLDKLKDGKHLQISSREDYFKDCDPNYESEMFKGEGIDFTSSHTSSYMPTRKRIEESGIGNDWY